MASREDSGGPNVLAMKGCDDYAGRGTQVSPGDGFERRGREPRGRLEVPSRYPSGGSLATFVKSSPDLVTVAGLDGRVRYVSPSVERLLGYSPEEFVRLAPDLARLVDRLIHPDDRVLAKRELSEAVSEPARPWPPVVSVRVRHRDGSWRFFEGHVSNLVSDPEVGGLVLVSRDVTERVRSAEEVRSLNARLEAVVRERTERLEEAVAGLKESEERFRLTFEAAAVGMAHVAPDGRWLRVNRKLAEIVGYETEELLELTFQDITHPDDLDADLRHVERMVKGEICEYSMEKRYIKKNRSRVWIGLTVSLVKAPRVEPGYFVSVVEDITERKLAELVPDPLTPRETEVLRLMCTGLNNPQIAKELAYSLGTVKLSVRCVLAKLGVGDRAAAIARATEIGLVPPPL